MNDCMPDFWAAYDASRSEVLEIRTQSLLEQFFDRHAADYRRAGVKATAKTVSSWLPKFDAMESQVRSVHRNFGKGYVNAIQRFEAALPDFDAAASPVGLLPSLFQFDAHLQPDGRRLPLYFGPDGIVRYHGVDADLDVLFSHELFHCYQAQKNPSMSLDAQMPAFANLWIEGVATYASERLNPKASLLHVLLDDAELIRIDAPTRHRAAQTLLARMDETDDATMAAFFQTSYRGEWPSRTGYYLGLLAARRMGEHLSLPQMAAMPTDQVRATLRPILRELATEA